MKESNYQIRVERSKACNSISVTFAEAAAAQQTNKEEESVAMELINLPPR